MSTELTVVGASGTGRATEEVSLTQFNAGGELQLQLTQRMQFLHLTREQALELAEELVNWAEE